MTGRILVVDDDRAFRVSTAALLREEGHEVVEAEDAAQGAEALKEGHFDLVLMDLRMPGVDGIRAVEVLRTRGEPVPVLMISGFGTVDTAVKALHTGVDDFLTKPVEPEALIEKVADLLRRRPSPREAEGPSPMAGIVGRSPALLEAVAEIERVADTDATVLIIGETGTGKELAARAIHEGSSRCEGPFVPVNCGALAEGVLESELFGHVKGAFTGAVRDHPGLVRAASGGTLFLDEIGDVTPSVQHRLLRVLQEREVVPVGSARPSKVDVRIVAATHHDLEKAVEEGRFRQDLFFRLDVFRLRLPPLRERMSDIPLLVEHYLRRQAGDGTPRTLSPLALRTLLGHHWPGNVRELFAALESASIRAGEGPIHTQHLPASVRREKDRDDGGERYRSPPAPDAEREAIIRALEQADGVKTRAAELLGMGRTTLWRKLKEYGLED